MRSPIHYIALAVIVALSAFSGGCQGVRDNFRTSRHRLIAWEAYQKQDFSTAYERFYEAAQIDSTDWTSQYYLGVLELEWRENPAEARRRLEIASTLRDAHPNAQYGGEVGQEYGVVDRPTRAEITDKLAEAIFQQGYRHQLATFLRANAEEYGQTHDYLRLARYLAKLGDPDAAVIAFEQSLKIADPTDAEPYMQFGEFYDAIGDRAAALKRYRQAYFLDPERKGLDEIIRAHGMVPGPTVALPPDGR